jgi:hypothetical protein
MGRSLRRSNDTKHEENNMIDIHVNGLGWQRDLPDYRDYTAENEKVWDILEHSEPLERAMTARTFGKADLRGWCSPIENQESLGSCRPRRDRHGGILPAPHKGRVPGRLAPLPL